MIPRKIMWSALLIGGIVVTMTLLDHAVVHT
jgi:hypothetical protein